MKIFYKTREVKSGLVTSYLKWKIQIWEARVRSTFGPYLKTGVCYNQLNSKTTRETKKILLQLSSPN